MYEVGRRAADLAVPVESVEAPHHSLENGRGVAECAADVTEVAVSLGGILRMHPDNEREGLIAARDTGGHPDGIDDMSTPESTEDALRAADTPVASAVGILEMVDHGSAKPWSDETRAASEAVFAASLVDAAVGVTEIYEHTESITEHGHKLISDLRLKPELFEDGAAVVMFSALAQRKADLEAARNGMAPEAYAAENTFIYEATALLALEYSDFYEQTKPLTEIQGLSQRELVGVYTSFTNVQATADLAAKIRDDPRLTQDFRGRAQPKEGSMAGYYVLHVLDIGDERTSVGMDYDEDMEGLFRSQDAFLEATGKPDVAMAWVETINGIKHLCLPLPLAQKIIDRERYTTDGYTDQQYADDVAILLHELTHTGNDLLVDGNEAFGSALEERRAELFSGDRHGYVDLKRFYDDDISELTGFDVAGYIAQMAPSTTTAIFYQTLAENVGLQTALELAMAVPESYLDESNVAPLQRSVVRHLGSLDGIEQRIYGRLSPAERSSFDTALDIAASEIAGDPERLALLEECLRRDFKPRFVLDMLRERAQTYDKRVLRSRLARLIYGIE